MKKLIAILLVVLALGLMFGCAQEQAAPLKSVPKEEAAPEEEIEELPDMEEVMAPLEADVQEELAEAEEPEAVPEEAPVEEPEEPSAKPSISQEDLDALNAEIEGMEFEDLNAFE